ncbi:MAG: hypothetical protein JSV91_04210 [Phycisphaerales bacterium]|nr:MAG: hypothetical protein JSV91_04210 [Phycisphaerales bacterium]
MPAIFGSKLARRIPVGRCVVKEDGEDIESADRKMQRRTFCKGAALGLGGLVVGRCFGKEKAGSATLSGPLPPPIDNGRSTALCLNSRVSMHWGLGGTATDQQISNVLWAAGKAPINGSYRTIYVRTPDGSYLYHPEDHSLEYYSGETVSNALRIEYERELDFDAGVSYVQALLASVSLWTGTQNQLASCPQMWDLNFGIRSVPGLTDELVAISSDFTLPNPLTDGDDSFDDAVSGLELATHFLPGDLTDEEISQILWAGYGCSDHWTANNRGGLTVPSWVAEYFLTGRLYIVRDTVARYCNRVGSNLATRDHRLELVQEADVREEVRQVLGNVPAAPCYLLLCLTASGLETWYQRLETGFVAGGYLAQAAVMDLGCHFRVPLSSGEQQALQQVTQIPSSDYPHAVVAVGRVSPFGSHQNPRFVTYDGFVY